jgi:hypothetical protein
MSMEIVKEYPPNYAEIVKVFPSARRRGVIFAYGDTIYNPSGEELSHHLKVHEAVHGIRQKELGVDAWWERYLTDYKFRYYEELLAHRAEYQSMTKNANRQQRRMALKAIAKRLASPLYGVGGGWERAAKDIKGEGVPQHLRGYVDAD